MARVCDVSDHLDRMNLVIPDRDPVVRPVPGDLDPGFLDSLGKAAGSIACRKVGVNAAAEKEVGGYTPTLGLEVLVPSPGMGWDCKDKGMHMTHNYARMQKPWGENTYVSNRSDWSTSRNIVSSTSDQ